MRELLFADDSALVAHSAEEMQKIVNAFSNVSKKFGLKINIKKTEVLYQHNSTRTREEDIMVDGNNLNSVLEFTYIRSTISLTMKYRGGWPRLVHLSADYARDSGTITMCPCGLKARYTVQSYRAEAWTVYRRQVKKLHDLLIRKNLRWIGHLMRMSPDRLPKQILYSQLSSGHRKRGRPRLRFKDTIKRNLKLRDIKTDSWTSLSQQRDKWRAIVK